MLTDAAPGARPAEDSLRMVAALYWFWFLGSHVHEARAWYAASLQRAPAQPGDGELRATAVLAQALSSAGVMATVESDWQVAHSFLEESVAIGRAIGCREGLAISLRDRGLLAIFQDPVAAVRYCQEGVALSREIDSSWDLALALFNLVSAASALGDQAQAHAAAEECLALFQRTQDNWGMVLALIALGRVAGRQRDFAIARRHMEAALALWQGQSEKWSLCDILCVLGQIAQVQGELAQANDLYAECLLVSHEIGDKLRMALMLHCLGTVAQARGQHGKAARFYAVSAAHCDAPDNAFRAIALTSGNDYEYPIRSLRAAMGAEEFAAQWAAGQALAVSQAIDLALNAPKLLAAAPPEHSEPQTAPTPPI